MYLNNLRKNKKIKINGGIFITTKRVGGGVGEKEYQKRNVWSIGSIV